MKRIKILITNLGDINHNYGAQGIVFPFTDKLSEHLSEHFNVEYGFITKKKYFDDNIEFLNKYGINAFKSLPDESLFIKNISFLNILINIFRSLKGKDSIDKVEYKKFFNKVEEYDVFINLTGIQFIGNKSIRRKYVSYISQTYAHWLSKNFNKLYLEYTKSYGPFSGFFYRFLVKKHFKKLPFIFVRGKKNLKEVEKLNLGIPTYSFPDISLSLKPEPESWAKSYLEDQGIVSSEPVIGISPTAVIKRISEKPINTCGSNHLILCKKAIEYFQKIGKQVIIIPHSIRDGVSEKSCDLAVSKKILHSLEDTNNVFLLDDMNLTYKQVRAIIGLLDFYMTGRYHSVCSALYMGVPTVCFAWHIKYKDILSIFLDDYPIIDCRKDSIKDGMDLILKYYNDRSWFDKDDVLKRRKEVNVHIDKSIQLIVEEINKKLDI
jgi:polysaccharide pyruvyl transferase WcaK-like protein